MNKKPAVPVSGTPAPATPIPVTPAPTSALAARIDRLTFEAARALIPAHRSLPND